MGERYTRLFSLPENLYSTGAPVIIAAGALLKDNQTGKVLAQLKLRNIAGKTIKAATVFVEPLDTVGKPLGKGISYQYLDLHADRDTDFGQTSAIALPDATTRSYSVLVSEVAFQDNTVWQAAGEVWESLPSPITLDEAFNDSELVKQYRIAYGSNCQYMPTMEKDIWVCTCGKLNHREEAECHQCGKVLSDLQAVDLDELKQDRDDRLAAEKQAAEEEAKIAAVKAKKTKKIALIALPIAAVVIVAAVLIFNAVKLTNAYNAALSLEKAGRYDEAIAAYEELGDYKDSPERIKEIIYNEAQALAEAGEYDEAIAVYAELGDYKDSAQRVKELTYDEALELISRGKTEDSELYYKAQSLLEELGDYQNSQELLTEISYRIGMTESVADTFKRLQGSEDDGEYIQELLEICEIYAPYCGRFTGNFSDRNFTLISDFRWDDGEIVWSPQTPDDSLLSFKYGFRNPYQHNFFQEGVYPLSGRMEVAEEWMEESYCIATCTAVFEDGGIHVTVTKCFPQNTGEILCEVDYKKVG